MFKLTREMDDMFVGKVTVKVAVKLFSGFLDFDQVRKVGKWKSLRKSKDI
jgi:hypothetical protein